jgi:hypothetical protein
MAHHRYTHEARLADDVLYVFELTTYIRTA